MEICDVDIDSEREDKEDEEEEEEIPEINSVSSYEVQNIDSLVDFDDEKDGIKKSSELLSRNYRSCPKMTTKRMLNVCKLFQKNMDKLFPNKSYSRCDDVRAIERLNNGRQNKTASKVSGNVEEGVKKGEKSSSGWQSVKDDQEPPEEPDVDDVYKIDEWLRCLRNDPVWARRLRKQARMESEPNTSYSMEVKSNLSFDPISSTSCFDEMSEEFELCLEILRLEQSLSYMKLDEIGSQCAFNLQERIEENLGAKRKSSKLSCASTHPQDSADEVSSGPSWGSYSQRQFDGFGGPSFESSQH